MSTSPADMIEVVPPGPGSIRIEIEEGQDWVPAEVSLHIEAVEPEEGTDTIAVLDLDAEEIGTDHVLIAQRLQVELTRGDIENLISHLEDILDPSEIKSVTGISPRCDICGRAQQPEDEWNGDTGNHVACEQAEAWGDAQRRQHER